VFESYDRSQSYQFNYDRGPVFASEPKVAPAGPKKTFLGLKVRSRLGIPAGLLLNSKWIAAYAKRGWDVLTYKTVRSSHRPCCPPPNWVFVEDDGKTEGPVYVTDQPSDDPRKISSSVCFGMPSMSPEVWREDVRRARDCLGEGQILIVSVVATPSDRPTPDDVASDFARCAQWASEAGADVIEANFSCPNVCSAEGTIYMDTELSRAITKRLREVLSEKPLLLKLGHFESRDRMRDFLEAINGLANGITMVNAISRPVLHRDGHPAFGKQFMRAGVLGRAIHEPSVSDVRTARGIIGERRLKLSIAAVGGVSCQSDAKDFFDAGADVVLMGSSPMYLPDLAAELKGAHPEW
jgi:dihydroorotate dehydrogenase (NAD+) catalytic subunit